MVFNFDRMKLVQQNNEKTPGIIPLSVVNLKQLKLNPQWYETVSNSIVNGTSAIIYNVAKFSISLHEL